MSRRLHPETHGARPRNLHTHPLNFLDLDIDLVDGVADVLVVAVQVQPQ